MMESEHSKKRFREEEDNEADFSTSELNESTFVDPTRFPRQSSLTTVASASAAKNTAHNIKNNPAVHSVGHKHGQPTSFPPLVADSFDIGGAASATSGTKRGNNPASVSANMNNKINSTNIKDKDAAQSQQRPQPQASISSLPLPLKDTHFFPPVNPNPTGPFVFNAAQTSPSRRDLEVSLPPFNEKRGGNLNEITQQQSLYNNTSNSVITGGESRYQQKHKRLMSDYPTEQHQHQYYQHQQSHSHPYHQNPQYIHTNPQHIYNDHHELYNSEPGVVINDLDADINDSRYRNDPRYEELHTEMPPPKEYEYDYPHGGGENGSNYQHNNNKINNVNNSNSNNNNSSSNNHNSHRPNTDSPGRYVDEVPTLHPPPPPSFPEADKNIIPLLKPRKLVLQKFTIYETDERMYVIGSNNRETMFRILEIDLSSAIDKLNLIEDNVYFNRKEVIQILSTLEETKGLSKKISCYGLLGFIKFTQYYYMHTITERSIVGILGGHYIYMIDATKLIPIVSQKNETLLKKSTSKEESANEQRFHSIFEGFSLDQNFYFSYTYDISNTLQKNFLNEKFKAFKAKIERKEKEIQEQEQIRKNDAFHKKTKQRGHASKLNKDNSNSFTPRKRKLDADGPSNTHINNNNTHRHNLHHKQPDDLLQTDIDLGRLLSSSSSRISSRASVARNSRSPYGTKQKAEKRQQQQQQQQQKQKHQRQQKQYREKDYLNEVDNEEEVSALLSTDEDDENYLDSYNEMFVWNIALLKPAVKIFDRTFDWFQPIIHGFFNQANISIYNKKIYVTLIARRSHHFAGARFLKRGVNDKGNVANEIETEQIVSDGLTTSFHDNANGYFMNPRYTSFVQHRGSIPLFWTQDFANINKIAKPPISIKLTDPFYSTSAMHFDKLFKRYGSKIFILNLIKQKEKVPRESKLGKEFRDCIEFLNHFLPPENKLDYVAWDMSRASKTGKHGQNVLEFLETYADRIINEVGIFHNSQVQDKSNLQLGICRTNCIDCLDRTNAAQFVIGKKALGHQLKLLGVYDNVYLEYDSDAVNLLTSLFHSHGNIIALQYGGSNLVNTMETYRKINQWNNKKNDLIENFKRFYSNSFIDPVRQDSINLFLGNYDFEKLGKKFFLWELPNDYYLHNNIGYKVYSQNTRSFNYWWNTKVFNYWKNLQFPPKGYLLNGEVDYDDDPEMTAIDKLLESLFDELCIDKELRIMYKRKFRLEKNGKFNKIILSNNSDSAETTTEIDLIQRIQTAEKYLKAIERKAKQHIKTKLEPYSNKQMDSYWNEYYAPRRLTNFKLLFDMNMKSSVSVDEKEFQGTVAAATITTDSLNCGTAANNNNSNSNENYNDIGGLATVTDRSARVDKEDPHHLQYVELSPFESRKPGITNSKLKEMYEHNQEDAQAAKEQKFKQQKDTFWEQFWASEINRKVSDGDAELEQQEKIETEKEDLKLSYLQLEHLQKANAKLAKTLSTRVDSILAKANYQQPQLSSEDQSSYISNDYIYHYGFHKGYYSDTKSSDLDDIYGPHQHNHNQHHENHRAQPHKVLTDKSISTSNIWSLLPNGMGFRRFVSKHPHPHPLDSSVSVSVSETGKFSSSSETVSLSDGNEPVKTRTRRSYSDSHYHRPASINISEAHQQYQRHQQQSQQQEQQQQNAVNASMSYPYTHFTHKAREYNSFDDYLYDPIISIKNLNLYNDNVKFEGNGNSSKSNSISQNNNDSTYYHHRHHHNYHHHQRVAGGAGAVGNFFSGGNFEDNEQAYSIKIKDGSSIAGEESTTMMYTNDDYYDIETYNDDTISVISDFYSNDTLHKGSPHRYHHNKDDHDNQAAATGTSNYSTQGIIMNPIQYKKKLQEYQYLLDVDRRGGISKKDLQLYNFAMNQAYQGIEFVGDEIRDTIGASLYKNEDNFDDKEKHQYEGYMNMYFNGDEYF